MRPQKILAPVDFSEASSHALEEAVSLAREYGAKLVVFHVHPIVRAVFLEATLTESPEESAEHLAEAEKAMQAMVEKAGGADLDVETNATVGNPTLAILEASDRYDLIVMSSHGDSGLSELLLGSVTERVVRAAKCSVLVVKRRS